MSRINLIDPVQKCNDHFPDAGKMVERSGISGLFRCQAILDK